MAHLPKISIITPSYNQAQYLEETILSVINQNYPNLEFIIIDGGSTDNSVDIIRKYTSQITYWVSEKDKGTYDANNKALKLFTGDYWCVVNSDDLLKPGALLKVAEYIKEHNCPDWITGDIEYIDENSQFLGSAKTNYPNKLAGRYFTNGCWIPHPVTFLSRKIFDEIGFFAATDIMDFEYWIRCENKGFLPDVINEVLGSFRYHDDSKSMNFIKLQKQVIDLIEQQKTQFNNKGQVRELNDYIDYCRFSLAQNEIKYYLYKKRYWQAGTNLFKLLLSKPFQLRKRWPYGMIKRFFTGVHTSEFSPKSFAAKNV